MVALVASDAYTFVTQYGGYASVNGATPESVTFVEVLSHPHQTAVTFPVADSAYSAGVVKAAAEGWVTIAETLWEQPNVIGVQQTEIVNASNQLVYAWIISVQGSNDSSWRTLTIANNDLGPQLGLDRINAVHAELVAVEQGVAPTSEA